MSGNYRIVRLQIEGFKRIQAIDITPDGDVIRVGGENSHGKSSLIDAISALFGGAAAAPMKPVRTGEEYAIIRGDLGDLKVTRYFDEKGSSIRVENADGMRADRPETMLQALYASLSFDPLAFARMKGDEQAAELRRLVPLSVDLDALKKADDADILKRRAINRDAKALQPRIAAIEVSGIVPEKPDRDGIMDRLAKAGETNAALHEEIYRRGTLDRQAIAHDEEADRLQVRAEAMRQEADRLALDATNKRSEAHGVREELEALPPLSEPVNTTELSEELQQADRDLALLARVAEKARLQAEFDELRKSSEALTANLNKRATERGDALASAQMPVEGLALARLCDVVPGEEGDDLIVTYDGEPFSQASGAQQLRVSMRLAMAANPKLRVLLIKDGSLLDKNGWALIKEMAAENDMQCWVEAVGDEGTGIIMEEGRVRGAPEPEKIDGAPKRRKANVIEVEAGSDIDAGELVKIDDDGKAHPAADKPSPREPRKPRALSSFTSKPGGSDLFGGEK